MTTELVERKEKTAPAQARPERFVRPAYQSFPGSDAHELHVHMPGVSREDVHISLESDELTIIGYREHDLPESWNPLFRELSDDDYRLRLRLNIEVDEARIDAHMEDGVLRLTLPIHEAAKPRVIAVS